MTKITLGNVTPRAVQELRGVAVFRATKSGIVVQKWPDFSKSKRSRLQQLYQKRFAIAATMAANPEPRELITAMEMAKGTEQVPRDILTMAALGRYYELVHPDGTPWGHVEGPIVPPDPEVEDMSWQWNYWDAAWGGTVSTTLFATKGVIFQTKEAFSIRRLRAIMQFLNTSIYSASIAKLSSSNVITDLVESPTITSTTSVEQLITFEAAMQLDTATRYAILLSRKGAGATFALPLKYQVVPKWLIPVTNVGNAFIATETPTIGQTVSTNSSQNAPFGLLIPDA